MPVFFSWGWGCVENWRYFFRLRKAAVTGALFTRDCNVIFRNYCVAIARKICNPATPVHGVRAKFADRQIANIIIREDSQIDFATGNVFLARLGVGVFTQEHFSNFSNNRFF